jgi:hypothetical protein
MDPPPKKGMSGAVIALIAVGICAALGIGGCIVCVGIGALAGNQHEARVNCERRAFGNVSCNVLHTAGRGAAEICWDVKLACENGVRAEAHACEFVGEKSTSTRVILSSSIRNNTLCGPFAAMSVENVTARGK